MPGSPNAPLAGKLRSRGQDPLRFVHTQRQAGRFELPPEPTAILGPDTKALKEQVDRLERIIDAFEHRQANGLQASGNLGRSRPTDNADNLEDAANHLEQLVFGPSVRPGVVETTTATPGHTWNTLKLSPTTPLASILGSSSFDSTLLHVLPRLLPNSPLAKDLVEDFFIGPIHITWHYSELNLEQLETRVDPVWFALYLMILAFALRFPHSHSPALQGFLADHADDLPSVLQRASVVALGASDYLVNPQVGHIQHFGKSADEASLALRHLDSAITTSQWLGLDTLSEQAPDKWQQTDQSLAHLTATASLECCRQLYHLLIFLDGTIFRRAGLWRLSATERPVTETTEASLSRKPSFNVQSSNSGDTKFGTRTPARQKQLDDADPGNKPFMLRGYTDEGWRFSTKASVESAKGIVKAQRDLLPWSELCPGRWIIGAATVLAIDALAGNLVSRDHLHLALTVCANKDQSLRRCVQSMIDSLDGSTKSSVGVMRESIVQTYLDDVKRRLASTESNEPLQGQGASTDIHSEEVLQSDPDLFALDLSFLYTSDTTGVFVPGLETFDWTMM
ncbi:hypothetical protein I316_01925 [Kwoniella heveanensis BCC8398]|uniref:Transcription factor domain-containing protein n=1 Tax=Kwoniella heveanensis BCC8398 TaxID=1296120 RepID=A0A1B9GYG4_9TREE|nr:hypothetical protein I316_01925 [Kwoniella heveanensis BCC8398]